MRNAWAVRDLTIPLKDVTARKKMEQWSHLCQVPFPEVERKKVSILIGTNIQEAFILLEVRKGRPNEPFAIRSDDNKGRYSPEVIKAVQRNFYVDDVLKSAPTTEKAIWLADQLTRLLSEGGFHLTKFTSNSRLVLKALPQEERANPSINLDLSQLPISRALGLHWDAASDTLQFKVVSTNKPPTKRGILSTVSSLFDPLGFLGPFLLPVKFILQELWKMDVQ